MPPVDRPARKGPSRPLPRWLLIAAAALLVARVGAGIYEGRREPNVIAADSHEQPAGEPGKDLVAWVPLDRAAAESRRTGKPILYEFGAKWCGPCKMMDAQVFADADAAEQIVRSYVPVRITDRQQEEGHNTPEVDRLMSTYSITGFPTLVVAWPGKANFQSKDGYAGRVGTLQWLAIASVKARADSPAASADSTIHP